MPRAIDDTLGCKLAIAADSLSSDLGVAIFNYYRSVQPFCARGVNFQNITSHFVSFLLLNSHYVSLYSPTPLRILDINCREG